MLRAGGTGFLFGASATLWQETRLRCRCGVIRIGRLLASSDATQPAPMHQHVSEAQHTPQHKNMRVAICAYSSHWCRPRGRRQRGHESGFRQPRCAGLCVEKAQPSQSRNSGGPPWTRAPPKGMLASTRCDEHDEQNIPPQSRQ
eukprot:scaffold5181_cov125-Isochrysis_galbana.AAC.3